MVQDMRAGLENMYEAANSAHQQEYLTEGSEQSTAESSVSSDNKDISGVQNLEKHASTSLHRRSTGGENSPDFPTLALTPAQFGMISALDKVGFKKYGVHIHRSNHSHAALIVRSNRKAFDEGKVVVQHWLDQSFIL